jgi:hypothetical protein
VEKPAVLSQFVQRRRHLVSALARELAQKDRLLHPAIRRDAPG